MKITDPKLYRELNVPFESADAVAQSLQQFAAEVRELRKKYRIPDVYVITRTLFTADGDEVEALGTFSCGLDALGPVLTAWAAGREEASLVELLGKYRRHGSKK